MMSRCPPAHRTCTRWLFIIIWMQLYGVAIEILTHHAPWKVVFFRSKLDDYIIWYYLQRCIRAAAKFHPLPRLKLWQRRMWRIPALKECEWSNSFYSSPEHTDLTLVSTFHLSKFSGEPLMYWCTGWKTTKKKHDCLLFPPKQFVLREVWNYSLLNPGGSYLFCRRKFLGVWMSKKQKLSKYKCKNKYWGWLSFLLSLSFRFHPWGSQGLLVTVPAVSRGKSWVHPEQVTSSSQGPYWWQRPPYKVPTAIWGSVPFSSLLWHRAQLHPRGAGIRTSDLPITSNLSWELSYSHPCLPTAISYNVTYHHTVASVFPS